MSLDLSDRLLLLLVHCFFFAKNDTERDFIDCLFDRIDSLFASLALRLTSLVFHCSAPACVQRLLTALPLGERGQLWVPLFLDLV